MEVSDMIIAAAILAGTFYILYRSLWKKKGCCSDCGSGGCCAKK
jgi:bacterioferritin-associated ferredoxin